MFGKRRTKDFREQIGAWAISDMHRGAACHLLEIEPASHVALRDHADCLKQSSRSNQHGGFLQELVAGLHILAAVQQESFKHSLQFFGLNRFRDIIVLRGTLRGSCAQQIQGLCPDSASVGTMPQHHNRNRAGPAEPDPTRTLRLIGATAAFLALLGIAILVFWFVIRAPRF